MRVILGLTGPNAAGKGEICKYLSKKGFLVFSLSDILRKIAAKKNIEPSRENLVKLGNFLRAKYGAGILAKWVIADILKHKNCKDIVIDSIRNPQEIKKFKEEFKEKFFLIYVNAPLKLRFKFMQMRKREGDPKTYKEFVKIEKKEKSKKAIQQQIHKCREFKDFYVNNNSSLKDLYRKIDSILEKIYKRL